MDLHLLDAEATDAERAAVDHVLGPPASRLGGRRPRAASTAALAIGGHAARAQRHLLLPALLVAAGARRLDQPGRA